MIAYPKERIFILFAQKPLYAFLVQKALVLFALRNHVTSSFESIVLFLEAASDNEYKLAAALELWIKKSHNFERLFQFITGANSWQLKYTAIAALRDAGKKLNELREFLRQVMLDIGQLEDIRLEMATLLISMQDIEGFEFAANHILQNPNIELEYSSIPANMSKFTDPAAIQFLLRLYLLTKQPGFNSDKFSVFESRLLDALYNIGIQNENSLMLVKNAIEQFIVKRENVNGVNFLRVLIVRIEDQHSLQHSQGITIDQAITEWDNLLAVN